MLGHLLPIFMVFLLKLSEITNFWLKIVIFFNCHFEYFCTFLAQNSVRGWGGGGGELSIFGQFWPIFMITPLIWCHIT